MLPGVFWEKVSGMVQDNRYEDTRNSRRAKLTYSYSGNDKSTRDELICNETMCSQ